MISSCISTSTSSSSSPIISYWVYAILFAIIFCETGVVVTPILPGDSLLFASGCAGGGRYHGHAQCAGVMGVLLMVAAWLGDATNFRIGRAIGPRAFSGTIPWLKKEYLDRTHAFYEKYGGKTIVLARFVPIVRTFAPFVAGVGDMNRAKFFTYNLLGGFLWVSIFIWGGYLFGNVPLIKENFGIVTIADHRDLGDAGGVGADPRRPNRAGA